MVGFSKTLARYRVSEWHTMYIDYETLKTYVNETKRKREEIMTPGTTSADDQSVYGRDSVDDSQWSRYATAPTLATELEEREKPPGEQVSHRHHQRQVVPVRPGRVQDCLSERKAYFRPR